MDSEPSRHIGSTGTRSKSGCIGSSLAERGKHSCGPEARSILVAEDAAPLQPIVTPIEPSSQAGTVLRCDATNNSLQMGPTDSLPMRDFLDFQRDNFYSFSPQRQVVQQLLTPPYSRHDQHGSSGYHGTANMSPGRVDCLESLLSLAWPGDQLAMYWAPHSHGPWLMPSTPEPEHDPEDSDDPEDVQGALLDSLSLDRNVESNTIPFALQANATWMSHFLFEPLRVVPFTRDYIFQAYSWGAESRWMMNLLSRNVYEITKSASYDLSTIPSFFKIQARKLEALTEASAHHKSSRELDGQYTLGAMSGTYEFITSLCKVGSLSSVLRTMKIAAPVFRRACPDPLQGLINLPALLVADDTNLMYYGSLDVLLGVLTGRPMFFRYDVTFTPEAPEPLFLLEDGPGLRWLYGIPDRLFLTLAKMNALIEDFGPCVKKEIIDELEAEIRNLRPIVWDSGEPALIVGRVVVQECWLLAALIYLYMGLGGADSTDPRVVKVRAQFMKMLKSVKPKRNPDLFLVYPMVILGIAIDNPNEQNVIHQRILGVSECARSGTMGHDFLRMLGSVWAAPRPKVWADLRRACWKVSGM